MYATTATLYYTPDANSLALSAPDHDRPTLKVEVNLGRGLNLISVSRDLDVSVTTFASQAEAMNAGFKAFKAGHATKMITCLA